ncbi:hypothetical protein [Nostoc sp. ATCC 53789]|jgi:hypothetical protein|uniref:hypothetical protein n=1 Tax=Nostoc sp. ATCC 53789 TaxID=76335 RepID=UPI000DED03EA|nr:hypothetical protein [Nostoc sp. ATCC 53789]MBD2508795.1 hypothetical protein [Desmonostoc muscorum FACHB-395]QHG18512.1 hypothetical protein GJB62_22735 [Nostoc sp. ATCC 53789]RCJ30399.1 hypothetical protein A6V25_14955 [Nostoc sp. ATCC 53789]
MDDIVKKLAGLGLPGVILVILTVTTGGSSAAVAAILTALGGPFGIVGGIALLGLVTVVGDTVTGYGIEAILKGIYTERSKTESVIFLFKEIQGLPITEELKLKLKNQLSVAMITDTKEVRYLKKIEIIEK